MVCGAFVGMSSMEQPKKCCVLLTFVAHARAADEHLIARCLLSFFAWFGFLLMYLICLGLILFCSVVFFIFFVGGGC